MKRKQRTNRVFSLVLTLAMLMSLLSAPAQAATRPFFSVQPQDGTALKTEGYQISWETAITAPVYWMYLNPLSRDWEAGGVLTKNPATLPYKEAHCLPSGIAAYKLVAKVNTTTSYESDPFKVTWVDGYAVTVNGGSGTGRYLEGDSVTITADDPGSGRVFKAWDGTVGLTFTDGSAETATATFTMPAGDVELTATYQRVKPDTTAVRPEGSGTEDDPFQISTVGELYWFTGFTNNYVAVGEDFAVERNKACAILMNDITVNPELLTESYGLGVEASLLASWSPISYLEPYCGTFDGNGHTISGLYYCEISSFQTFAFIAEMGEGGVIKDLTLKDTYFYPEYNSSISPSMPRAAGIVGFAGEGTVENCHFDGVVGASSTSYYGGGAGGIAYSTDGVIKNCTTKGRVIGQASFADNAGGARVGGIVGTVYGTAVVSDCTNDAEVTCWDNNTAWGSAGGIVGYLAGTVRDCRNRGVISGQEKNYAGGIVGRAAGAEDQYAVISRCWNEANFTGSGIVAYIHDEYGGEECTTVKNCYNAGSVTNGIVGTGWGSGISIAYCHNWGTVTDAPIYKVKYVGDTTVVENCFYRDIAETDSMAGTTFMTTGEFASSLGFVTKRLNAGNNGNWKQGGDYPILNKMFTLTVNNGTGSGTYGVDTEVTITATVPDGYVFAGWDGIDGLIVEAGQPARDTVATKFLMPKRDVTLTAKFTSIAPTRPEGRGTVAYPFQISTVGELYWFAGFVNGNITADDITVNPSKACAKLMNDITVNYELLKDDGTVNGSSGFAYWIPIGFYSNYSGTFDGQNHTISGLRLDHPDAYAKYGEIGFVAELTSSGCIRDLTIADSLFAPPVSNKEYYVGGIVGRMWVGTSVINCHFQGTIRTNTTYYWHTIGGIAGCSNGTITDCTSEGWINGYSNGGTGGIVGNTYGSGMVSGCVNYASVVNELPSTYYGGKDSAAGGIAAVLNRGTIRDCCNKGDVSGEHTWVGGIVGRAEGWESQWAYIIRCWNEGSVNYCGIAGNIYRYTTVENCYNTGTVRFGITSVIYEVDTKVLYCHNAKAETANPIIGKTAPAEIANCYYLADSELDEIDGSTYKTATEFADDTVLALLNNGHWTQGADAEYPVLGDPPTEIHGTVTVTGTSATASVTVEELSGKAILIIAQYSGGQMQAAQTVSVKEDDTFAPDNPFTHANGCTYKAFLLDADTYAPLCAGAELGGI